MPDNVYAVYYTNNPFDPGDMEIDLFTTRERADARAEEIMLGNFADYADEGEPVYNTVDELIDLHNVHFRDMGEEFFVDIRCLAVEV